MRFFHALCASLVAATLLSCPHPTVRLPEDPDPPSTDTWESPKALAEIARWVDGRDNPRQVARFLSHPDPRVRAQASRGLGLIGGPKAQTLLLGLLNDPKPELRREAAFGLFQAPQWPSLDPFNQQLQLAEARDGLLEALEVEENLSVRRAELTTLRSLGGPSAGSALRKALSSDNAEEAGHAAMQLALWSRGEPGVRRSDEGEGLGPEDFSSMKALASSQLHAILYALSRGVWQQDLKAEVATLALELPASTPQDRAWAATAWGRALKGESPGRPTALDGANSLLERIAWAQALAQLPSSWVGEVLLGYLQGDQPEQLRMAALEALLRWREEQAQDPHTEAKRAAALLSAWELTRDTPSLSCALPQAMARLPKGAQAPIFEAWDDLAPSCVLRARASLHRLEDLPALTEALSSEDAPLAMAALDGLIAMALEHSSPEAVNALLPAFAHSIPAIAEATLTQAIQLLASRKLGEEDTPGVASSEQVFAAVLDAWDTLQGPGYETARGALLDLLVALAPSPAPRSTDAETIVPDDLLSAALDDPIYAVRRKAADLSAQRGEPRPSIKPRPVAELQLPNTEPPRTLTLTTELGDIVLRLRPDLAPKTCARMAELARQGYFDGSSWHRVVPGFVVQGGDPSGTGWGGPAPSPQRPDPSLRCELSPEPFLPGTVGMALSGRDTGGSQFFIALSELPHLMGRYTVWAEVKSGLDLAAELPQGAAILRVTVPGP